MLIAMVGLPASGKSTKALELANKIGGEVFSSDHYRELICGNESDQSHNKEVFDALYKDLVAHLAEGKSAILDCTNTTLKARLNVLDKIKNIKCTKVAYVMTTDVDTCVERDSLRDRKVGKEVIYKFLNTFQFPQYFEGWRQIFIDGVDKLPTLNEKTSNELLKQMSGFDQENPYHKYDLALHSLKLAESYDENSIGREAAWFHDVGKLFTKTKDDNGIAHYYNHANVGTYYLLSHLDCFNVIYWEDLFKILFLINYHMLLKGNIKENTKTKYRNIFGDYWFEDLEEFSVKDDLACRD